MSVSYSIFDDGMEEVNPNLLQFKGVNYTYPAPQPPIVYTSMTFEWLTAQSTSDGPGLGNFVVADLDENITILFNGLEPNEIDGGVVNAGGVYQVLQPGMTVGPNSSFAANGDSSLWRAGASGYIGFRTLNPNSGETNFGYARFSTTGPTGNPATLHSWTVDTSGAPVVIERD